VELEAYTRIKKRRTISDSCCNLNYVDNSNSDVNVIAPKFNEFFSSHDFSPCNAFQSLNFYSASALIAMPTAVIATPNSVCLSVTFQCLVYR